MARRDWYCEDVLSGKLKVETVWENGEVLAFDHPKPVEPVHVVVIPKKHVSSIMDPQALEPNLLVSMVTAVQQSARLKEIDALGFRVKTGAVAPGVTPHMHWHVLGPGIPPLDWESLSLGMKKQRESQ